MGSAFEDLVLPGRNQNRIRGERGNGLYHLHKTRSQDSNLTINMLQKCEKFRIRNWVKELR